MLRLVTEHILADVNLTRKFYAWETEKENKKGERKNFSLTNNFQDHYVSLSDHAWKS